jgi:hypothetical protein
LQNALKDVPDTIIGHDMRFINNGRAGLVYMDGAFSNKASIPRKLPQFSAPTRPAP